VPFDDIVTVREVMSRYLQTKVAEEVGDNRLITAAASEEAGTCSFDKKLYSLLSVLVQQAVLYL